MSKRFVLTLLAVALIAAVCGQTRPAPAEMRPFNKIPYGVPPYDVLELLLRGNQAFVAAAAEAGPAAPAPVCTWLADADSAVGPQLFGGGQGPGLYTVRNLGNQVALAEGSLDYGVRGLFTPVLLITGTSRSGAVRLAMTGDAGPLPSVREALALLAPAMPPAGEEESFETAWLRAVEANVDYQVGQAVRRYEDRLRSGRLTVIGAVFDLHDLYGRGAGRLVVINVNGIKEEEALRRQPVMVRLDRELLEKAVGRN